MSTAHLRRAVAQAFALFLILLSFAWSGARSARAQDATSTNFILRDAAVTTEGGRSSSPGFELFDAAGQLLTSESTSTGFTYLGGFLFFPVATSPVLSATAGNAQVALSWTASAGTLANITSYEVGTATVSGGPYTFESVGNVLSFTKTGLTNGTAHYFRVRALAGTLFLAQSGEVSATPAGAATPAPSSATGGSLSNRPPPVNITFAGRAYPLSTVTFLRDGQVTLTTIAGPDARFEAAFSGLTSGNYIFSILSEDAQGNKSALFTFPVFITDGAATNVGGIFLSPTIAVDKSEVKAGENIAVFGQSVPESDVTIAVDSEETVFFRTEADENGVYLYDLDTSVLERGQHFAKSKAALGGELTPFSKTVGFVVGERTVRAAPERVLSKGDANGDRRVNLVDFSVMAYWYGRSSPPATVDVNSDGKITLVDFSIMAFYWTG